MLVWIRRFATGRRLTAIAGGVLASLLSLANWAGRSTLLEDTMALWNLVWTVATSPLTWAIGFFFCLAIALMPDERWNSLRNRLWTIIIDRKRQSPSQLRIELDQLQAWAVPIRKAYPRLNAVIEDYNRRERYREFDSSIESAIRAVESVCQGDTLASVKAQMRLKEVLDLLDESSEPWCSVQRLLEAIQRGIDVDGSSVLRPLQQSVTVDDMDCRPSMPSVPAP